MGQLELFVDERGLFEKLCSIDYLEEGFKAVKRNQGSPGVDGVSIRATKDVKFLGMTIIDGVITISKQSMKRAMTKLKELTPRGTNQKLEDTIKAYNKWYTGWAGYYSMTQYPSQLKSI